MSAGRKQIQDFVGLARKPAIEGLASIDYPDFNGVTELLVRLLDVPVRVSHETTGTLFYAADRNDPVLTISSEKEVSAENSLTLTRLNALLRAARIHFVESYDWVLLLPETRTKLISQEASDVGLLPEDFKKMLSKWAD